LNKEKSPQIILFLTVFLYLVGFGILIPLTPHLSRDLGATSTQAGLLMATYSVMQFLFSPLWGRLSDRLGRKKILLICLIGEAISYVAFAYARTLEALFVARALTGFFGASLSTANAAMADITGEKDRSKGMALIGAAFGLGFVIGPALGGGLALFAEHFSTEPFFRTTFVSLSVSVLFILTFLFAVKKLPETLSAEKRNQSKKGRWFILFEKLQKPVLASVMTTFFLLSLAMSSMEATLVYFMADRFSWTLKETSFGFAYIGLILVFTQGFLVRKLLPKIGERKILLFSIPIFFIGMAIIAPAHSIPLMTLSMTLISLGIGQSNPSLSGATSLLAEEGEQGSTLGANQSLASLGRILGPSIGGYLYSIRPGYPFLFSTVLGVLAWVLILSRYKSIPDHGKQTAA
jgi:MFS transporter, DHA1 family, tetracycline resistance protein